jgi:hypothetical protein
VEKQWLMSQSWDFYVKKRARSRGAPHLHVQHPREPQATDPGQERLRVLHPRLCRCYTASATTCCILVTSERDSS